ncbi:multicopper oxidase domain-containing protein [Maritalea porphyrae]
MLPHPFHIHDVKFRILDRNGQRPNIGERGHKDVVDVNANK